MSDPPEATETAIIQWINTFENSRSIKSLEELADGTILFQILSDVDSSWFRTTAYSLERGNNWIYRYSNLKRLYVLISRYYEEKLGAAFSRLPQVDLNSIAREGNVDEIIQLCKYVLTVAVQSPDNTQHVQHITKLNKEVREQLLQFVNETMQYNQRKSVLSRRSTIHQEDDGTALQRGLSRMTKEKKDLETLNIRLIDENSEAIAKNGHYENEIKALKADLETKERLSQQAKEDLESSLQQKEEELQAALNKLKGLKEQNASHEQKVTELQQQMSDRDQDLKKVEDLLKSETEENDQLKLELDTLHERNETLANDNETLTEECKRLQDHADALENERQSQHQHLETSHQNQIAELQSQTKELAEENHNLRDEIDQHLRMIAELETGHKTHNGGLLTENQELVDRVEHLQSENKQLSHKVDKLQSELRGLEDDIAGLQAQKQEYLQEIEGLTRELDRNLKKTADLEEQVRTTKKRRRSYSEPDNEDDATWFRRRVQELENEVKELEEAIILLELKESDDSGVSRSKLEYAELLAKRLQEEYEKVLFDRSKLKLEKDALERENKRQKDQLAETERVNKEMKDTLQVIGQGDSESIRQQCAALTNNDLKLQETQFKLKTKIYDLKQFIIEQDKMIKQAITEAQNLTQNTEVVDSLKAEIQILETDNERLKRRLEEAYQQVRREQRLMLSAWYDMANRTTKKTHKDCN